ncbi:MAG: VCBS repeat-containing protein [Cytophagales bacterium]|nr:VCBS repeat-containing protein [Cytophagales bacterium]
MKNDIDMINITQKNNWSEAIASIAACCFFLFAYACGEKRSAIEKNEPVPSDLPGNALALKHCGSCHAFTAPELLPSSVWEKDVLPSMGHRLGIYRGDRQPDSLFEKGVGGQIVKRAKIYPEKPQLAREDWQKIVDYYIEHAPDTILPPIRKNRIVKSLEHFKYKPSPYTHRPPLTIMIKILPDNRGIVFGDGKRGISNLSFLKPSLEKDYNISLKTTPVHYYEKNDTVFLTTIGDHMYPHDAPNGTVQKVFKKPRVNTYSSADIVIKNLQRPVFSEYADLDADGLEDIVICEYGNLTGKLVWYQNQGNSSYSMRPLRGEPGAICVRVEDFDGDGLLDIVALMAQGDEGIFWYKNRGNGTFEENRLLSFLPLYGSQYFELVDMNRDGYKDILYVCGDNADLTPILKGYHGIYLYINDGGQKFKKEFFYQLNGAYKAIPMDYDMDGDLDIASISFFPDYYNYPEESFVYLENDGALNFSGYSFPEATRGRWIVMDAGDIDGDGDIDIALGSFVSFIAQGDTTGLGDQWIKSGPSVALLENTIR